MQHGHQGAGHSARVLVLDDVAAVDDSRRSLIQDGLGALEEFAITMLFGIILATSSSIFIAAPILLFLGEDKLRRGQATEAPAQGDAAAPAP